MSLPPLHTPLFSVLTYDYSGRHIKIQHRNNGKKRHCRHNDINYIDIPYRCDKTEQQRRENIYHPSYKRIYGKNFVVLAYTLKRNGDNGLNDGNCAFR